MKPQIYKKLNNMFRIKTDTLGALTELFNFINLAQGNCFLIFRHTQQYHL